ncbi:MAG: Ig-like domain-containing protein [Actinomycetota bacterium]
MGKLIGKEPVPYVRKKAEIGPLLLRARRMATLALLAVAATSIPTPALASLGAPSIDTPANGTWGNAAITRVAGSVPGDATLVRVTEGTSVLADTGIAGGRWTTDIPFADGTHTISAIARDASGAWSSPSSQVTFFVDTATPLAPVITQPSAGSSVPYSSVTIEGTSEPRARIQVSIDPSAVVETTALANGTWSVTRSLADANYSARARATDAAGNQSSASGAVAFAVDTTPPTAPTVSTPAQGSSTGTTTVEVTGRAEPGSAVTIYEANALQTVTAGEGGTWNVTLNFAEGMHRIFARARDAAGNIGSQSSTITFTVDLTPPEPPRIESPQEGEIVSPSTAVVHGVAEPGATVLVIRNNIVSAITAAGVDGRWSVRIEAGSGIASVMARARDAAGNLGAVSEPRAFVVDADPPVVSISTSDETFFTPLQPVRITGGAQDNFGVQSITLDFIDMAGRGVASRTVSCAGCPFASLVSWETRFAPTGRYIVKAWALDRVGNRSAPATITITNLTVSL